MTARRIGRVAVVAPSCPVDPVKLERGCALVASWGVEPVVFPHVLDRRGFLAGDDAGRAGDLVGAWCDPAVDAVLCARGGYGATRLLELLDWRAMRAAAPKPFVGASDVTALHVALGERLGVGTWFGPMVATEVLGGPAPDPTSAEHLRRTLLHDEPITDLPCETIRPGAASGRLAGGTLSLLAALAGTPYAGSASGCIAFLEDVGEVSYRLDRLLTQLLQSGWFDGVRGIVLGSWHGCGNEAIATVCDRLGALDVPIAAGLAAGHGPVQHTLPLGSDAALDATSGRLSWGPSR